MIFTVGFVCGGANWALGHPFDNSHSITRRSAFPSRLREIKLFSGCFAEKGQTSRVINSEK